MLQLLWGARAFTFACLLLVARVSATEDCCWCDGETPAGNLTTTGSDGRQYDLVFSDEFNTLDRRFEDGEDPKWTGLDRPHFSDVHFQPGQIKTVEDGEQNALRIRATRHDVGNKTYISGMLQGWNKFCFTGGIIEASIKFPKSAGYWPAFWMFGNLGRAVYEGSCKNVWPWTFDVCDEKLQADLPSVQRQKIQTCDANPGPGLNPYQGRGAPEIDMVEGWYVGKTGGNIMQNFQVAPRLPRWFWPYNDQSPSKEGKHSWYRGLEFNNEAIAGKWYGHQNEGCAMTCPDVLGCGTWSSSMANDYHRIKLEWRTGDDGYLKWYWKDTLKMTIPAKALTREYNDGQGHKVSGRQIPNEPMYLMANIAIHEHFAGGAKAITKDPGDLMIDWIRVYQDPERINTGCSPSDYPTREYIESEMAVNEKYGPPIDPLGEDTCPHERHGLPAFVSNVTVIEGESTPCDPETNLYTQDVLVYFEHLPFEGDVLDVNAIKFNLTRGSASPLNLTLTLEADGQPVIFTASFPRSSAPIFTRKNAYVAPEKCGRDPVPPTPHPTTPQPTGAPSTVAPTEYGASFSPTHSPSTTEEANGGGPSASPAGMNPVAIGVIAAGVLGLLGYGAYVVRRQQMAQLSLSLQDGNTPVVSSEAYGRLEDHDDDYIAATVLPSDADTLN